MSEHSQPGAQSAPEILPIGTRIDERYEVLGVLGRGGYATVYRARHIHMGRDAAVKVLDAQRTLDTDVLDTEAERFLREARIASSIQHPNVVTIYDFGFDANRRPYIAMELLEGYDLAVELRRNGPLAPARAVRLFKPALEALGVGHRIGIVHKDLKPANLFIMHPGTPDEQMVVLDFGVARTGESQGMNLTGTGELLGTPRYLAPEYIKSQTATPAVDVYQMALILSEALCGRSAVEGAPYQAMMCHCTGNLAIPHVLLNGPVGQVFRRAIAIDHRERYADCETFKRALESVESAFAGLPAVQPPTPSSGVADTGRMLGGDATNRTPAPFDMPGALSGQNPALMSGSGPMMLPSASGGSKKILVLAALVALVLVGALVAIVLATGGGDETTSNNDADGEQSAVAAELPEPEPPPVEPEPEIVHEDPVIDTARVVFVSEPLGANVYLDGEGQGVTPLTLDLPVGEQFDLAIERDGYAAHVAEFVVETDSEPLVAKLEALPEEPDATAEAVKPAPKPREKSGSDSRRSDKKKKDKDKERFKIAP